MRLLPNKQSLQAQKKLYQSSQRHARINFQETRNCYHVRSSSRLFIPSGLKHSLSIDILPKNKPIDFCEICEVIFWIVHSQNSIGIVSLLDGFSSELSELAPVNVNCSIGFLDPLSRNALGLHQC